MDNQKFLELLTLGQEEVKELVQAIKDEKLTPAQLEELEQTLWDTARDIALEDIQTYDYLSNDQQDLLDLVGENL